MHPHMKRTASRVQVHLPAHHPHTTPTPAIGRTWSFVESPRDRWDQMSCSRRIVMLGVMLALFVFLIVQTTMEQTLKPTNESISLLLLCLVAPFRVHRDNPRIVGFLVTAVVLLFVLGCVAVCAFAAKSTTFWWTLGLVESREPQTAVACALRVAITPICALVFLAKVGCPVNWLPRIGFVLVIISSTTVMFIVAGISEAVVSETIFAGLTASFPGILAVYVVHDNEVHTDRSRRLAAKAEQAAIQELKNQQQAVENQQRVVAYIFHEVRNPINGVMLASELTQDMLESIRQLRTQQQQPDHHFAVHHLEPSLPFPAFTDGTASAKENTAKNTVHVAPLFHNKKASSEEFPKENTQTATNTVKDVDALLCEVREMVEDIRQSTLAAVRVLNDALNLQKLESGAFEFVHKSFLISDLVSFTLRMVKPQLQAKRLQVKQFMDKSLQNIYVRGDFHRLQQVLLNYLSNASKFTPTGGVVEIRMVQIQHSEVEEANNTSNTSDSNTATTNDASDTANCKFICIRTSVFNTGKGIKDEDKPKIFQPWSQIRAGEDQQGSGLGLALCKAFVEKGHGGRVWFNSVVDQHTEFFFEIGFHVGSREDCRSSGTMKRRRFVPSVSSLTASTQSLVRSSHSLPPQQKSNVSVSSLSLATHLKSSTPPPPAQSSPPPPPALLDNHKSVELAQTSPNLQNDQIRPSQQPHPEPKATTTTTTEPQTAPTTTTTTTTTTEEPQIQPQPQPQESQKTDSQEGIDVLIVEDSAMSRRLLAKTLKSMNVSSEQAVDGQEGVDRVLQVGVDFYDIILMDKEMPRLDGFEATRTLREMGFTGPIVGCTGNVMDDQVAEFLRAGANQVLGKPVSQGALASVLQQYGVIVASSP